MALLRVKKKIEQKKIFKYVNAIKKSIKEKKKKQGSFYKHKSGLEMKKIL